MVGQPEAPSSINKRDRALFKVCYQLVEATDIANAVHDVAIPSMWVQENALHNISIILANGQEWHLVIPAPIGHPEGQVALAVGEVGETAENRSHLLGQEVFQVPRGVD